MRVRKLFGALGYLAFLALCIEVALQLFYYVTAGDFLFTRVALPIYAREPYAGIANRPDYTLDHHTNEFHVWYHNNHDGFRVAAPGVEFSREKPDDTFRIMLLGPSFAYGWGVGYEESFGARLLQQLSLRGFAAPRRIELINAGVPSMPPAPQLAWFEARGASYAPDLVIQFICGSMAVSSDPTPAAEIDDAGYLVYRNIPAERRWRERAKKLASVFYAWLLWTKLSDRLHAGAPGEPHEVLGAGREMTQASAFDADSPEVREALKLYEQLARAVTQAGAQLLVVHVPLSYAVHPEDEARWRHLGVLDVARQTAFDAAFVRYLNEQGIPALDVTDALRAAAAHGERTYYWLDIHWTQAGNAAAADAVARHLGPS